MNIANLFHSAQSVLVVLAGLGTLAEDHSTPGPAKKAAVLAALNPVIDALPLPGASATVLKTAARALAPMAVDLLVAKANAAGLLPKSSEPSSNIP